jgi:phage terminase large subunit-like protein
MYVTVDRNCRKRRESTPWALQTSTMYEPGQDSIAERSHARARSILEGRVRESRLLFDHREAPAEVDLTDRASIVAALREVYGPFAEVMDLDGIVENEFWNVEKDIEDSRRYFFNQPTAARNAWMTHPQWVACEDTARRLGDEDTIVMFFDGSKSDDATGLVGCRVGDGHLFVVGCWEKPAGAAGDGWEVDRADVDRTVRQAFADWDVVAFYADVKEFEQYVDQWAADFRDRLLIDATAGKYPHPVGWDMRGRVPEFTGACGRFVVDVEDRALTHDGDQRLRRHVLNARRAPNKWGVSICKTGRESPDKIDLAVCAVGARQARRDVIASGKLERRKSRSGTVW